MSPVEFDLSAGIGESVAEILEVTNTGDELVELTLAVSGDAVTLSTSAATLQAGEVLDIEIEAECAGPGERQTDIRVTGRTGKKAVTVTVPFVLNCTSETGVYLAALEVFQGPMIYRKDYRTGEASEPVPMMRPENGAEPVETWVPAYYDDENYQHVYPSKAYVWREESKGLVTAVWNRRAAVAVTVAHPDDSPPPSVSAAVGKTALPVLLQETAAESGGLETVTVFDLHRSLYARGNALDIAVETDDGEQADRLVLFGEEIEPIQITWVPIVVDGYPPPEGFEDAEQLTDNLATFTPIAERVTKMGTPLHYEQSEWDNGETITPTGAIHRLNEHHALHACGYDEIYIGAWDPRPIVRAEGSAVGGGRAAARHSGSGNLAVGSGYVVPESWDLLGEHRRDLFSTFAHELGHLFGIGHTACGIPAEEEEYPYPDATLGPTPIWDALLNRFVNADTDTGDLRTAASDRYHDLMSYCGPGAMSDWTYQINVMFRQHDWASRTCENPRGDPHWTAETAPSGLVKKSAPAAKAPESIAITGAISADGITSISMVQPTNNAPWAPHPDGEYVLEILDAGGTVLHRQPIRGAHGSHGHGEGVWSARVPYFEDAETVILRGLQGDLRSSASLPQDR